VNSFFAIVPKVAGIAVFIRFVQVPFEQLIDQWKNILVFMALASMILGAVAAIGQTNIKRLIAYSSIGHIGFVLAGISTGTLTGYSSSIAYISIYVIMNLGVFGCIFLMKKDGEYCEDIQDLAGISKQNPLLAISFLIIMFSLAGIPPLAGFFAKFYVFMSVIESGMYTLAIVGLLSTVISAFYYLRIIKIIYFDEIKNPFDQIKNFGTTSTVFLTCTMLVFFFLYPSILNNIVNILSIN
jgi:NADH-quinone oxidoreductase subunit N